MQTTNLCLRLASSSNNRCALLPTSSRGTRCLQLRKRSSSGKPKGPQVPNSVRCRVRECDLAQCRRKPLGCRASLREKPQRMADHRLEQPTTIGIRARICELHRNNQALRARARSMLSARQRQRGKKSFRGDLEAKKRPMTRKPISSLPMLSLADSKMYSWQHRPTLCLLKTYRLQRALPSRHSL